MDRLADLQTLVDPDDDDDDVMIPISSTESTEMDKHMSKYQPIAAYLTRISVNLSKVEALKSKDHQAVAEKVQNQCVQELNNIMSETGVLAKKIKESLDEIKEENETFKKSSETSSAQVEIRDGLYQQHIRRFHSVMNEYNSAVYAFKKNIQDRARRHLKIVDVNNRISDEELEEIIENGQAGDVIKQALFSENLETVMRDIRNRHEEIMKLEQSVLEIHELFKDLSNLVDLQQESLDVIEQRVSSSKAHITKGHKNVVQAADYSQKTRKRKCMFLVILLVVGFVVLSALLIPKLTAA